MKNSQTKQIEVLLQKYFWMDKEQLDREEKGDHMFAFTLHPLNSEYVRNHKDSFRKVKLERLFKIAQT